MFHDKTIFKIIVLFFLIVTTPAFADSTVLPVHSKVFGKSYADWSAAWLRWALSVPASSNPVLDETGEFASVGQQGKVWFLAGTTRSDASPIVRKIMVPVGTALFFPIVNKFWVNTPEFGDPEWSPAQEQFSRDFLAQDIDKASGLFLQIDGRNVVGLNNLRVKSKATLCTVPSSAQDNIFGVDLNFSPYHCVADGYWVILRPFQVGLHTVRFKGAIPGFSLDISYLIKVKPKQTVRKNFRLHN